MNSRQKAVARKFFKCKIERAEGQAFEDLFTRIMSLAVPGFKPIKSHGSEGDRKNDGYVEATQTYYQVYAPENLSKSHAKATQKLSTDFEGLKQSWPDVRSFFFVMNDKYKGPYPSAAQDISALKSQYNLENSDFLLAKDIEKIAFDSLPEDALIELVDFPPDPSTLPFLEYSVLSEVISHVMQMPSLPPDHEDLVVPDWDKKITFNGLSEVTSHYLNVAGFKLGFVEEFLNNSGELASQELRDRMISLYEEAKTSRGSKEPPDGDSVFARMLQIGVPKQQAPYQDAFLVVLAKYFETCDIFDRPEDEQC